MRPNLNEDSAGYRSDASIYERFSACEDVDGIVLKHLIPLARGARVFDAGCGSGKYTAAIARVAVRIDAQDQSAEQLALAGQACAGLTNVRFHKGDLCEHAPKGPFDLIVACWVLGTMRDDGRRTAALRRLEASLAEGGRLVLVENDVGGTFEALRGRVDDPEERTQRYNAWLLDQEMIPVQRATTRFRFADRNEARAVFGCLWGDAVGRAVETSEIEHRIVIFEKRNGMTDAARRPAAVPSS